MQRHYELIIEAISILCDFRGLHLKEEDSAIVKCSKPGQDPGHRTGLITNQTRNTPLLVATSLSAWLGFIAAPVASAADTGWDCQETPSGEWECTGKYSPPDIKLLEVPDLKGKPADIFSPPDLVQEPLPERAPEEGAVVPAPPATPSEQLAPGEIPREPKSGTPTKSARPEEVPAIEEPKTVAAVAQPFPGGEMVTDGLCARPKAPEKPANVKQLRADALTHLTADNAEIQKEGESVFTGNVNIDRADQNLKADEVRYNKTTNVVDAEGNVRYRDSSIAINSTRTHVELDTDKSQFDNSQYHLYDNNGHGTAKKIYRDNPDVTHMEKVTYTTCPPGNKDWELSSDKVELDHPEDQGSARDAVVRFKGVPVFYTPYITFPLSDKRKSGFLTPAFGSSSKSGVDASIPYYWNIAPNQDATFTPRYLGKRGAQLQGEYRYLSKNSKGRVNLEALPDDRAFNDDRLAVSFRHNQTLSPKWTSDILYNYVSDKRYFEDLGNSLSSSSTTHLARHLKLNYSDDHFDFIGNLEGFQTIDRTIPAASRPYNRLPQLLFAANFENQPLGLTYGFNGEFVHFDRDTGIIASRVDVKPTISLPIRKRGWFVEPKAAFRFTQYDLGNNMPGTDDTPSRSVPILSLDSGLFFERNTELASTGFIQTLEPRVFYLYKPFRNQNGLIVNNAGTPIVFDTSELDFSFAQLFRDERFTGGDRVSDANQITVALTTRLLESESGKERLRASIGQIFFLKDRRVTLPGEKIARASTSDLAAEIGASLTDNLSAIAGLEWDTDDDAINKGVARVHYQSDNKHIVNLAYRKRRANLARTSTSRRADLEQTDFSFFWPVTRQWAAIGRWNYSVRAGRTLEGLAGFEYDNCCWALRLVGRQFLNDINGDENNAVFLQLQLKGLTNFGNKVDSLLEEGILGYGGEPARNF